MNQKSRWWKAKSVYDQSDATGFIRLNALRLKLRATLKTKGRAIDLNRPRRFTEPLLPRTLNHEEGAFTREALQFVIA